MNSMRAVRILTALAIAIAVASAGLLGGATPALAKSKDKPTVYTFYVDSRGGVLYYHRVRGCTKELDGVQVKKVRATLASIKRAGYRPCPKCKPAGYTKPPKRLYASKYSRYYSQNRKARFITAHRASPGACRGCSMTCKT